MAIAFTRHAQERARQRSIPQIVIDLVVDFGRVQRHRGADVYSLDKRSRRSVRSYLGCELYRRIEEFLGVYVVVADAGRIITVAHRYTRLKTA